MLGQDVAHALRTLRRAPGFTLVAVTTLALGIGANSAIFSVVHGVLLEPLPYRDADRLYRVRTVYPDGTPYSLSAPDFMSVRQDTRTFDGVEAYTTGLSTLAGAGEPREVRIARVSDGLFSLLGMPVAAGATFTRPDHDPGRANVAVLDHGYWQRQFGGDRGIVGRSISLAGRPYIIAGVLAEGARLPAEADLYTPIEYDGTFNASTATQRRGEFLAVIGHARPGADPAAIAQDLDRIGTALQQAFPPTNAALTFGAISLPETIVGDVRTPLFVLLGAVGFVLLVACANVANLLLARASARQQEMAVRTALGAGRGRLMRQLVTESVVLASAGGLLGLGLAWAGTALLVAARPADIPRLDAISVNASVAVFTFAVSIVTGLVFGTLPALRATGRTLSQAIHASGRNGGASTADHRVRAVLVVAEMALAVVLLMGAGLLIRSFVELTRVSPGFQAERAMSVRISLQGPGYEGGPQVRGRVTEVVDRLRRLPGVTAVAVTSVLPLSGNGSMLGFAVAGAPPPPANVNAEIAVASVTPDYFKAIGAEVRRGRAVTDHDTPDTARVAVINEAGRRQWFAADGPIGRQVLVNGQSIEVVGLVADVLQRDPREPPAPQLFLPFAQRTVRSIRLVIRATGDPLAQAPAVREALHALDPNLAIASFVPLTQLLADAVARPRFYTSLLTLFAAVGLVLAATGIFGVMSYAVAQRTREISIRMALGAPAAGVLRLIVGRALVLAGTGLVIGLAAAVGLGRVIQGQLFGVRLIDPLTVVAVVVVLGVSAAAASFIPARRAARLDPAAALRQG